MNFRKALEKYSGVLERKQSTLILINLYLITLSRINQCSMGLHDLKLQAINETCTEFDLQQLFKFCQPSEAFNYLHYPENLRKTGKKVAMI